MVQKEKLELLEPKVHKELKEAEDPREPKGPLEC